MASFNRVILLGNLTRDPQVRYIQSGTAVAELGLAVNRTWFDKQSNQRREEVTFVDVVLWGRTAEIAGEYLAKGRQVLIEGHLKLDTWDDRESGQKRSKLRVVCENMTMVGARGDSPGGAPPRPAGARAGGGAGGGSGGGGYGGGGRAPIAATSFEEPPMDRPPEEAFYDEPSAPVGNAGHDPGLDRGGPQGDEVPF